MLVASACRDLNTIKLVGIASLNREAVLATPIGTEQKPTYAYAIPADTFVTGATIAEFVMALRLVLDIDVVSVRCSQKPPPCS